MPWRVDGHWLLGKNVLAGRDGGLQMGRAEMGGRGQNHHVHAAIDDVLIRVEADEAVVVGHGHLLGKHLPQIVEARLQAIGKGVADGRQLHVRIGVHGLGCRSRAAPAASDQADLQDVAPRGMGAVRDRQIRRQLRPRPQWPKFAETNDAMNYRGYGPSLAETSTNSSVFGVGGLHALGPTNRHHEVRGGWGPSPIMARLARLSPSGARQATSAIGQRFLRPPLLKP